MVDKDDTTNANEAADEAADLDALWGEFEEADKVPGNSQAAPSTGDRERAEGIPEDRAPTDGDLTAETDPAVTAGADDEKILASLPPEARAIFERERTERQRLEQSVSSDRGRIAAYQRQLAEIRGQTAPKGPTVPNVRDRLKAVEEEYPEVAGPMIEILDEMAETLKPVVAQREADEYAQQEQLLEKQHPGYVDLLTQNADAFTAWLADQPRYVQEGFARNESRIVDAKEAADIVGRFKSSLGSTGSRSEPPAKGNPNPLAGRRARQLEGAHAITDRRSPAVATGIPEDGDPEELWKAFELEEQRKAQRR